MSQRGQQSTAHEYDDMEQCIWCGMYKANIKSLSHDCTPLREQLADLALSKKGMGDGK